MTYYEEHKQTHPREPDYEELRDQVKRLEEQTRGRQKEQQEQDKWEQAQEKQWWPGDPKEIAEPAPAVMKMARARARHQRWNLQLPSLEDLYAVQVGIGQVLDALLHDQLNQQVGRLVLSGLRLAATNLARPDEVWEQPSRFESHEQLALPGFEADLGLPPGMDLDTPPEVAFPETETGTVSKERASLMEVMPLDVELMELQQRAGLEAVVRRMKQLEQAEDRRYKRAQAQLAHARYVVRAAAQNAARESQFVMRSQAALAEVEAREQAAANPAASSGSRQEDGAASSAAVADGVGAGPARARNRNRLLLERPGRNRLRATWRSFLWKLKPNESNGYV